MSPFDVEQDEQPLRVRASPTLGLDHPVPVRPILERLFGAEDEDEDAASSQVDSHELDVDERSERSREPHEGRERLARERAGLVGSLDGGVREVAVDVFVLVAHLLDLDQHFFHQLAFVALGRIGEDHSKVRRELAGVYGAQRLRGGQRGRHAHVEAVAVAGDVVDGQLHWHF